MPSVTVWLDSEEWGEVILPRPLKVAHSATCKALATRWTPKKKYIFADLAISSDGGRGLGALASHELLDSVQSRVYHLGPLRGSVTVCDSVSYERRSSGAGESF